MEDTQNQKTQGSAVVDPEKETSNQEQAAALKAKQDAAAAAAADREKQTAAQTAGQLTGTPGRTPNVVGSAESLQDHVDDVKDDVTDAEKAVLDTVAPEHHSKVREIFTKLHNGMADLLRHANYHKNEAQEAANQQSQAEKSAAEATAAATAKRTTATSDAHLNRGNGGAVTGNPGASFSQASAAQVAVEQGAELPGVAKIPQPDAAVR